MTKSTDDHSFSSCSSNLDPEESSDGKDISGHAIPKLHDVYREGDPMVGVEIDHCLQGKNGEVVTKHEQEKSSDLSSSSKCITSSMITEQDMMQLDDQNLPKFDANEVLLIDHQLDSPGSQSAEFDLSKLCDLIEKTRMAGFDMDGKDVILFLGTTGSGKTSTMLYLAGALFAENEHGEYEIKLLPPCDSQLEDYKISGRSRSCTRCLQTTTVTVDRCNIVLCDTPGFGDTEGDEFDIANGISMVQALQRAKSVKPVLVFNKGWQSDRFVSLTETLQSVLRLTGQKESLDFSAFRFVFTDCNKRDLKKILKKLRDLLQDIEVPDHPRHSHLMMSMVNAMIDDISSDFLYVDLAEDDASQLLVSLLQCNGNLVVTNPTDFFVPFVSEKAGRALISQLKSCMIEIDNFFSNGSYHNALPLICQLIQVRSLMQMVEYAVPKSISSQRMLQSLFECSRYHLSQAFSFTSDQQDCVLSELDKLKEVNECVDLFRENANEVSRYTSQVESHVALLLESYKTISISSNPTEWAWTLVRLNELATIVESFPFLDGLARRCNKAIDQIDDHVCREIGIISVLVQSSLDGLVDVRQTLIDINIFSAKVVKFNSTTATKYCFHEKIDVFSNKIRSRLTKLSDDLSALTDKVKDSNAEKKYFTITSHMIIHGGNLRSQLISVIGTKTLYKILFADGWHHQRTLISKFDENLIFWLTMSLQTLEVEVCRYNVKTNSDMDFAALMDAKSSTQETLQDLQSICSKVETWQGLEQVQTRNFLNHAIKIRTNFESYVQDIDEHHTELVQNCQKANVLASQFLSRLRSGNECICNVLSELDEASSWDSWSIYDEEKKEGGFIKSIFNGVKSVFGMNAESSKLKKTLDDIIIILKKNVAFHLDNFCSIDFSNDKPIETATYLLQKGNKNVRLVILLLRLRGESSLRSELIDSHITRFLSRCMSALSTSLKMISQLPSQLVKNHNFDKVGYILSLWKASNETWKVLRSFANSPLSQHSNVGASELQKCICDCQEYEAIVDLLFNEVKKIQSEVETSSFDCVSSSLHEKNKFYDQLEQLLRKVKGFQKHKDHAMSSEFESLLNIEHVMLSKYSFELEQMGLVLMKKMDKFPSDSSCVINVNSLMSNLDYIELIFEKTSPSLSRQACEIKSSAQQEVETVFARTRETVDFESTASIFEFLIKWRRIGYEVLSWRSLFYQSIDEFLHTICQNSANASSILLELSLLLRSVKEQDAVVANLLLSEHSIFEGSMNAIFDEKTAKQDIKYVLGELMSLSKVEKLNLESLYAEFESAFLEMLGEGLRIVSCDKNTTIDPTKSYFKSKAEVVMKDFDLKYSNQLSQLTAVLFARWSVKSNVSLFHTITTPDERRYLKKPHPAQVVAIWLMLNLQHGDYAVVKNILVELKTGEGKSVVLGITATILALVGFNVDCVCYSTFLSTRDYDDFRQVFECFGVLDRIRYGTIRKFALDIAYDHYANAESAIKGHWSKAGSGSSAIKMMRILLIDEVDVFFGDNAFGYYDKVGLSISTETIRELFYKAWNGNESSDYLETRKKLVDSYPKESRVLIEGLVSNLVNEAWQVKNEETFQYFVLDNKVVKKYFDGVAGYMSNEVNFMYIKYAERGEIPKTIANAALVISPIVGEISYAELPFEYTAIVGVTGTLRGLGDSLHAILSNKYCIENYYYVPSVFGMNRLTFSCGNPKDVVISNSEADFLLELKQEILNRRRPIHRESGVVRPVMVFFRSKSSLMTFYESDMMKQLKDVTSIIDETMSKVTRDALFLKATEQGSITLMIRDFGRGTDFKCFDYNLQREGGVHVIQAFFSTDQSEEVQIKGRTARQGADGSYSIIINAADLWEDFSLSDNEVTSLKQSGEIYSSLHNMRMTNMEQIIQSQLEQVKIHEVMHYRTIACIDAVRCGKKEHVLSFFEELNGLPMGDSAFENNNKKQEKKNERKSLLRMISDKDKEKRFSKISIYTDDEKMKYEMARVRKVMKREDSTHYQILGIPKESSRYQIKNAVQKLSKLFHPDKCRDDDAVAIMQRLNDIKDDLCCDLKRKRYDDGLVQPDLSENP